jgi:hypothetical protein
LPEKLRIVTVLAGIEEHDIREVRPAPRPSGRNREVTFIPGEATPEGFAPMNDERLKREIEESLAVEPSAQFMARVRRHLENESSRPSKQVSWTAMAAGLAAAAVVGGIGLFESFMPAQTTRIVHEPRPNVEILLASFSEYAPLTCHGAESSIQYKRDFHSSEPEVVIDPREAAAFQSFMEDMREQKIDAASLESLFQAAESVEAAEIAPLPIAGLEPIDIKPLNPAVTERGESL